jgi:hypothetical protein
MTPEERIRHEGDFMDEAMDCPYIGPIVRSHIASQDRARAAARQAAQRTPQQIAADHERERRRNEIRGRLDGHRAVIRELRAQIDSNLFYGSKLGRLMRELDDRLRDCGALQGQLVALL